MNILSDYNVQSYETVNQALRKNQTKKFYEVEQNYEALDKKRGELNNSHIELLLTMEALIRNAQGLESTILNCDWVSAIVHGNQPYKTITER